MSLGKQQTLLTFTFIYFSGSQRHKMRGIQYDCFYRWKISSACCDRSNDYFSLVRKTVRPIRTRTVYSESFLFEILLGKKNLVKKKKLFIRLLLQWFKSSSSLSLVDKSSYLHLYLFLHTRKSHKLPFMFTYCREIHVWSEDTVSPRRHLTLTTGVNSAIYRLTRWVGQDEWVSCLLNYSFEMLFSSLWLALTLRVYTWSVNNGFYLARKYAPMFVRGLYLVQDANSILRAKPKETCEVRE